MPQLLQKYMCTRERFQDKKWKINTKHIFAMDCSLDPTKMTVVEVVTSNRT